MRISVTLAALCALCLLPITMQGTGHAAGARCAQEWDLRSLEGRASTSVTFVNNSRGMIRTYWIDYQGRRVFYAEIPPGGSYVQQTFLTHPWVVTNSQEDCLGVYMPAPYPIRVDIGY
jgi:hypothetical protein